MEAEQTLTIDSGQGIDLNYEIAGVGARAYAFTIDWHIRVLIAIGWILILLLVRFYVSVSPLLIFLPAAAVYLLYHPLIELLLKGSTPGKKRAGVRILSQEGVPPSVLQVLVRNIFRLIDSLPLFYGVGIVTCVCNRTAQRFGDMAAGTVLVYDEDATTLIESAGLYTDEDLNMGQMTAVRSLLDRWDGLDSQVQIKLARRLLAKLGQETRVDNVARLKIKLEKLVPGGR